MSEERVTKEEYIGKMLDLVKGVIQDDGLSPGDWVSACLKEAVTVAYQQRHVSGDSDSRTLESLMVRALKAQFDYMRARERSSDMLADETVANIIAKAVKR
jgi:hypothetical protein